jgi:glyoxalase family protein
VEHGARFESPWQRFGDTVLRLTDPDGMPIELVGTDDGREPWEEGEVPPESAIRGFHHVALSERNPGRTLELMTETLGFRVVEEEGGRTRLAAGEGGPGGLADVMESPGGREGRMGVGTVHHVAFRVPDEESQLALREEVESLGYGPTPVIDRIYFRSVYFREPGGVLFEIATDPPGFAIDESTKHLGEALMLPPWLEKRRAEIEEILPPLGEG